MPWESLAAKVAAKVDAEKTQLAFESRTRGTSSRASTSQRSSLLGPTTVRPPRTTYPQGNILNYFERVGINMNPGGPGERLMASDYDDYSLF